MFLMRGSGAGLVENRSIRQHTSAYILVLRRGSRAGLVEKRTYDEPHVAVRDVRDSAEAGGNLIHVPK